jgi:uncharacterized protein YecE (DUF72 family)
MAEVWVGVSGWRYREWRGPFYPHGLRQADELRYTASQLNSVEINGSFYSLQRPSSFEAWAAQTPDNFTMAVKGGRFITHMKKLRDVREALANFFASGLLGLQHKLGPVLWQFPENMPADLARFEAFFELLPRDTRAAERLAREHADWLKGRTLTHADKRRKIRHAIELRNPACATPEFIELLRRQQIGLVIADTAGRFPFVEDVTADFVYVRLHGETKLYGSDYEDSALTRWARRILLWHQGREPRDAPRVTALLRESEPRDVYIYFDNDMHAYAPRNAVSMRRILERKLETKLVADDVPPVKIRTARRARRAR